LRTALVEAHDRALAPLSLTVNQAAILYSCSRGEGATPGRLAELYGLEASSITRTVQRLEKKGLITRVHSRTDRRQVMLRLTAKGNASLQRALPIAAQVAAAAWKGVTDREKKVLKTIVEKVLKNLEHVAP